MRIAISNIAWDTIEDEKIAGILMEYNVDAIDIAPGKYFPNPIKTGKKEIYKVKRFWQDRGIELTGMQSLLFGTSGLNVFGSRKSQQGMLDHIEGVCRIANYLGLSRLVFGSPKNRDRSGLSDQEALDEAVYFFNRLGDIALQWGVTVNLEPNPTCYGANFMTTGSEALMVVRSVNHPAIKLQLDTGAISTNNENIVDLLNEGSEQIGHIHISEPELAVIGDLDTNHFLYASAIRTAFDNPLVSLEMLATTNEAHHISIERAINFVINTYRKDK